MFQRLAREPAVLLTAAALFAGACSAGAPGNAKNGDARPSMAEAVARYGYGPKPDPHVTYQPDVVLIGGGPTAIRSVSSDGLRFTLDGSASGVASLTPGKIMFAASDAVGRVVSVEPDGADRTVLLAPVAFTDVIRDAQIHLDQRLDLDAMSFQAAPDQPGFLAPTNEPTAEPTTEPGSPSPAPTATAAGSDTVIQMPAIRLVADTGPDAKLPPPSSDKKLSKTVDGWDITAYKSSTAIGASLAHGIGGKALKKNALKASIDAHLITGKVTAKADIGVSNGVVGRSDIEISGVTGAAFTISAGAPDGLSDNRKLKLELPVELKQPTIIGGFPATISEKFKFLVESAFSAKDGNLSARGEWGLDGPIGIRGSQALVPAYSVRKSILKSLQGVSVGVNGMVTAVEFRFGIGFGIPLANAGPYFGVVLSTGLTVGSSIGIVQCRVATLRLTVRGGLGVDVASWMRTVWEKIVHSKIPEEVDLKNKDIVNSTKAIPDVVACR